MDLTFFIPPNETQKRADKNWTHIPFNIKIFKKCLIYFLGQESQQYFGGIDRNVSIKKN